MPEKWTGRLIGKMHNEGVSNDDLAAELGVSKAYVSMLLNGHRKPAGARERMEAALAEILRKRQEASE